MIAFVGKIDGTVDPLQSYPNMRSLRVEQAGVQKGAGQLASEAAGAVCFIRDDIVSGHRSETMLSF